MAEVHGELERGASGYTGTFRVASTFDSDRIWAAFTEPRLLAEWFGAVTGDLRPGGRYAAEFSDHLEVDGVAGDVLECEAPARLAVTWRLDDHGPTEVAVELEPRGDDAGTNLLVTHSGIPTEHAVTYAASWQAHLEMLGRVLHGRLAMLEGFPVRRDELTTAYETRYRALLAHR